MPGYSGTPLATKLGIKEDSVVAVLDGPPEVEEWLAPIPVGATLIRALRGTPDIVVAFVRDRAALVSRIAQVETVIFPSGALWIAWPKQSSKLRGEVTEDALREVALPRGLVDNKVCAVSEDWSGLRLVWRKELRATRG